MKKIVIFSLFFITFMVADTIKICGTGDSQELLRVLARAYEVHNPADRVIVPDSIGSGGGILSAYKGKCDLGRVAREIKKSEQRYNLNYLLFAKSAVVFVTHSSVNKVRNLTTKEVVGIFDGTIKDWGILNNQVKGKIYVARRESGDSSNNILEENIKEYKNIKNLVGKVIFTTQEEVKILSQYKNTIGYLPLTLATGDLNVLSFNGMKATAVNIQNNLYKLVLPLGLVYPKKISELSQRFIDFIYSGEGQKAIITHGSIPILKVD